MIRKSPNRPAAEQQNGWPFFFITMVLFLAGNAVAGDLFTDITAQAGLADPGNERGVAWGDYDNDGDPDLYIAVLYGLDRLYRNEGGGTFVDVTREAALADSSISGAPAWCDYDGDGDLDLFVGRVGANALFRNKGDGTFTDVAGKAGVTGDVTSWGVAWGDYDRNGTVDLYVANFGSSPNRLYSNNGDGTFTDVAESAGVADRGSGTSASWCDYDDDGDLDLYLANKDGANRLYRNEDNGSFTEVAEASLAQDNNDGIGTIWGDCDDDGDFDLFISVNYAKNRLFLNGGEGTFIAAPESAGLDHSGSSRGIGWGDFDNDGDLDLYLAKSIGENKLYENEGNCVFADITAGSCMGDSNSGTAVAWADFDEDGDLDLVLSNFGTTMRLFRNNSPADRHWLDVRLESPGGNTRAVGARVQVFAGDDTWVRDHNPGTGYQSQSPHQIHFGLGSQTRVDSLVVRWPAGEISRFGEQKVDQVLLLTGP